MPLLLSTHPFPDSTFALWQAAEPDSFFKEELPFYGTEKQDFEVLSEKRKMEWLSSRWLLHRITGEPQRLPLAKDAFSKPFFLDKPDLHCSLSHSQGVVGALLSNQNCGCDIQVLVEKMPKLAHKFLGKEELKHLSGLSETMIFEYYHLIWTAKESLYKSYGLKALDFRYEIFVRDMLWDGHSGKAHGYIEKGRFQQHYQLRFGKTVLEEGALIWAVCL